MELEDRYITQSSFMVRLKLMVCTYFAFSIFNTEQCFQVVVTRTTLEQILTILSQQIGDKVCYVIPVEIVVVCSQRQGKYPPCC